MGKKAKSDSFLLSDAYKDGGVYDADPDMVRLADTLMDYVSEDDIDLDKETFLKYIADRINDDLPHIRYKDKLVDPKKTQRSLINLKVELEEKGSQDAQTIKFKINSCLFDEYPTKHDSEVDFPE